MTEVSPGKRGVPSSLLRYSRLLVLAEALVVTAADEAAVGIGVGPWGGGIPGRSRTPPPYLEAARVRPGAGACGVVPPDPTRALAHLRMLRQRRRCAESLSPSPDEDSV